MIHEISTTNHIPRPLAFISGGHLVRHLGFLSPHQQWPLYLGRFKNFRVLQTFWYITFNVVLWSPPHLQLSLESHPTKAFNFTNDLQRVLFYTKMFVSCILDFLLYDVTVVTQCGNNNGRLWAQLPPLPISKSIYYQQSR